MSQSQAAAPIAVSDNGKKNKDLKAHKPEKWEMNAIGDFLLKLHKQQILSKRCNWIVPKDRMRYEFSKYLREPGNENFEKVFIELNGTADIGTLLFRTRFLINTQRGSPDYRIKDFNLFRHRDYKLDELDKLRRNAIGDGISDSNDDQEKDADGEEQEGHLLIYEGSELQMRKTDFSPENLGCFVCQLNFRNALELEEHIVFHSEESNFMLQSSSSFKKFDTSIFKVSYLHCKNSHIMCFTLDTRLPNVVIEKIVLVQPRSFHYLNDARVPYKIAEKDKFYINSQLFSEFLEQPIIILFHTCSEDMRLMEQHHFVHSEAFPVVQLNLNAHRLSSESQFEPVSELPDYNPDEDLVKAMQNDFPTEYLIKIRSQFYDYIAEEKKLSMDNVCTVLKILLQIEDLAFRRANYLLLQREVKLRHCGEIYSLKLKYLSWSPEIPGGRLQNLPNIGDKVYLIQESAETITVRNTSIFEMLMNRGFEKFCEEHGLKQKLFVGRIKGVVDGRILFESNEDILLDKLYFVIISPNRMKLRQQQNALASLESLSDRKFLQFLFPQHVDYPKLLPSKKIVLQNEAIASDAEQLQAVQNITSDVEMTAPYLIIGGPGSGKTAVIVESIFQLYLRSANSKILVVAGEDSACDEIALRLCKVLCKMHDERAIARIYGYDCRQRRERIDELLLEYSNLYDKRPFLPSVDVLHEFRILVCTAELVGQLTLGRFGRTSDDRGVFTHIFLDDAASLTEAESLVCLVNTWSPPNTKLILAGDPKQMDPILYSARARELGLNVSLMERLLALECYFTDNAGKYNRSILTKLVRNYRSNPKIVALWNSLYYNNQMVSAAPTEISSFAESWYRVPNPAYPIIFHEVGSCAGNNTETNNSSCVSNYNAHELDAVMSYVKDLMYNGINGRKVAQKDIGIISPYRKQALRIQDQLNVRGWYQIDVGTPEDFLGRENSIIIVSFVWVTPNSLDILDNSRRLNFMISRAKSLLILVGNSKILNQFSDLRTIIDGCRKNGSLLFGSKMFWQDSNFQKPANNDNGDDDNDDDDDDDIRSQCSEMSTSDAKKRRYRNRRQKKANKAAGTATGTAAGTAPTESSAPNKENDNTKKPNQIEKPTNENKSKNKKGNESQTPKNSNNNKNGNGKKNVPSNPFDDFLGSLPNVPTADAETLNAIENMKEDIVGRMQKLKVETSSSAVKDPEPLDFVLVNKPSGSSTASNKKTVNENITSPQHNLKLQKLLNHGNATASHAHVKRLDNNNPKRQGNADNKNNPNAQRKDNRTNNANQKQHQQQQSKVYTPTQQKQPQQQQQPKQSQQAKGQQQPQQRRNEQLHLVHQMQQPSPVVHMAYPYQQPQPITVHYPSIQPMPLMPQIQQTYPRQFYHAPMPMHQQQPPPQQQQPPPQQQQPPPQQQQPPPQQQQPPTQQSPPQQQPPPPRRPPPPRQQPVSPIREVRSFQDQEPRRQPKEEDKCVIA